MQVKRDEILNQAPNASQQTPENESSYASQTSNFLQQASPFLFFFLFLPN